MNKLYLRAFSSSGYLQIKMWGVLIYISVPGGTEARKEEGIGKQQNKLVYHKEICLQNQDYVFV